MDSKLHPFIQKTADGGLVMINPGTGGLDAPHSEVQARANMRRYISDCRNSLDIERGLHFRRVAEKDYGDGRYAFIVAWDEYPKRKIEVQMPGYELSRVRPASFDDYDHWQFPRLYVDGSSWLWEYAALTVDDFEII